MVSSARDSNRFDVSVNLAPQSKGTFRLFYEELLQRRDDKYEIVINIHPGQPVKDLLVEVCHYYYHHFTPIATTSYKT